MFGEATHNPRTIHRQVNQSISSNPFLIRKTYITMTRPIIVYILCEA